MKVGIVAVAPGLRVAVGSRPALAQDRDPGRGPARFDRAALGEFSVTLVVEDGLVRRGVLTAPVTGMIRRIGPIAR